VEETMAHESLPANVVAKFFVACLGAHAWAVGIAQKPIPGAVLHTREAAIRYASELAAAAGVSRVHLDIVGGFRKKSRRSGLPGVARGRVAHAYSVAGAVR
jgi:hypothetical protein